MFDNFNPFKKKEEPKKMEPAGPSFEEVAMALPEDERAELLRLKGVPEEIATEGEDGLEIDHDMLSEHDEKLLEKYYTLLKRAQDLFEQKKQSGK
ncbi:MAG: hypothetical protein WCX17_04185 [Parcubacteria group bacterium]|jgi:hypothetical protein